MQNKEFSLNNLHVHTNTETHTYKGIYMQCYQISRLVKCANDNTTKELRKKYPYSEFFWYAFSHSRTDYGQIRTRKTPNTDTFHAVSIAEKLL